MAAAPPSVGAVSRRRRRRLPSIDRRPAPTDGRRVRRPDRPRRAAAVDHRRSPRRPVTRPTVRHRLPGTDVGPGRRRRRRRLPRRPPATPTGSSRRAGVRWALGQAGDQVATGDWSCRGTRTVVLLRPSTGEVFRFDAWAVGAQETGHRRRRWRRCREARRCGRPTSTATAATSSSWSGASCRPRSCACPGPGRDPADAASSGWWAGRPCIALALVGLAASGHGALSPPPLGSPGRWPTWFEQREPAAAAFAILRLAAVGGCWYLAATTVVGAVLRLLRADVLVAVADRVTSPRSAACWPGR